MRSPFLSLSTMAAEGKDLFRVTGAQKGKRQEVTPLAALFYLWVGNRLCVVRAGVKEETAFGHRLKSLIVTLRIVTGLGPQSLTLLLTRLQ